jgi:four helix bundle protein
MTLAVYLCHMPTKKKSSYGSGMHRKLIAWQLGMDLVEEIYRLSNQFPADERFGLTAQIRRAAVSIPSNVAEGDQRATKPDKRNFALIARGSVAEVETQLEIAVRLEMVADEETERAFELLDHVGRVLTNLRRAYERS